MSFEEFSRICDLLNSPDVEICELGRQMMSEFNTVKVFGYNHHTELKLLNKKECYYTKIPTSK